MQKLVWLLNNDKLMHILAGIVMIDVFMPICALFLLPVWCILVSFVTASTIMVAKETVYDLQLGKGVCSMRDFIAGEIGILFQVLVFIINDLP